MSFKKEIKIIEQNHLGYFTFFPDKLGFGITDIHGVTVINTALESSIFNGNAISDVFFRSNSKRID